jgi:hypothetical protein|tara:strand:- start:37602 stop:38108 length:507 start_codon:yes stop_codon:yes gene_type:complete
VRIALLRLGCLADHVDLAHAKPRRQVVDRPIASQGAAQYKSRVSKLRHHLARLVGVMLVMFAIATPALAVDAHSVSHWVSPVSVGDHHHHDEETGAVIASHGQHDEAPDEDRASHDHGPVTSLACVAPALMVDHDLADFGLQSAVRAETDRTPRGLSPPPDGRPPRLV